MGIKITTDNFLSEFQAPIIRQSANPNGDPQNIVSPDHSLTYTSVPDGSGIFELEFGTVEDIEYVAISGHTVVARANLSGVIEIYSSNTLLDSVRLSRNNNVMFTFDEPREIGNLRVFFRASSRLSEVTVSYVAAGRLIDIEEGEQAGYKRNWLKRSIKQRTTSNRTSAPVSAIQKTEPLTATLNIPNIDAHLSQNEYQDFIDYTFDQPFFIKEVDELPESCYICYDPEHDIVAHRATPLLNRASIKFKAYNGLQ